MSHAVRTGAVMTGAVMTGAVMTGAMMIGAVRSRAVMIGAATSRAVMIGAAMSRTVMIGVMMSPGAVMEEVRGAQTVLPLPSLMYAVRFAKIYGHPASDCWWRYDNDSDDEGDHDNKAAHAAAYGIDTN
jgi:hypothetical protein